MLNLRILKAFRLKGLWGIYLNTAFRDLGLNLIGVFLPIYVYKIVHSLPLTFLFFAIYHFTVLPTCWLAGRLTQKIGLDMLEFISGIIRSLFLLFLMLANLSPVFLVPSAILWGITIPFCWLPYYVTVTEKVEEHHYGQTVSKLEIITKIASGIGPFLGALVIMSFGFNMLYFFTILVFLMSGLVIFLDDFDKKRMRLNFGKMLKRFKKKSLRPFWLGMVGNGIEETVYSQAWYLFIYLTVASYAVLGGIESVSFLLAIVITWSVGKWVDKKGPSILNYGVAGNVINWLVRPFLLSGLFIFLADLVYKLLNIFIWTPFMAITYKKAKDMHQLEFFIQKEWLYHLSGFGTSLLMVLVAVFIPNSWSAIFSLAIVGLLMCTLILTPGVDTKIKRSKELLEDDI